MSEPSDSRSGDGADALEQAKDRLLVHLNQELADRFPALFLIEFSAATSQQDTPMPDNMISEILLTNAQGTQLVLLSDLERTKRDVQYNTNHIRETYSQVTGTEYDADDHEWLIATGFHLLGTRGAFYSHEVKRAAEP